jgi:hypothetical protein
MSARPATDAELAEIRRICASLIAAVKTGTDFEPRAGSTIMWLTDHSKVALPPLRQPLKFTTPDEREQGETLRLYASRIRIDEIEEHISADDAEASLVAARKLVTGLEATVERRRAAAKRLAEERANVVDLFSPRPEGRS